MPAAAHDEVIQQPDIHKRKGLGQLLRNAAVGFAGLAVAGWMIVAQDQSRGIVLQGALE
jgi:hypothetical protein